jgi:hypothetical protein
MCKESWKEPSMTAWTKRRAVLRVTTLGDDHVDGRLAALERLGSHIGYHHDRSLLGESSGDRPSNAGTPTGDDGHPFVEPSHVNILLVM